MPTSWSITDTVHDTKFSIGVISDTTRQSKGIITKISTGAELAHFVVDQSGTGTMTYANGKVEAITSWTQAD
jgi:hypothetical protein